MKKKLITIILALSLCASITGCTKQSGVSTVDISTTSDATILSNINISSGKTESVGETDTFIELGNNITVDGKGATVENNKVTITSAGTYSIKGSLTDGQIIVNAADEDKVYIILNGVNITCSNSAPMYVKNAKKTVISLADNTENYIKDAENYVFEGESTDEPNAAIFSKADLTFIGSGSLTVDAKYKNGVTSKDDLKIESGNINVNAKADGLRGKDSVVITNGNIKINSGEDGINSSNNLVVNGGTFNISSGDDGMHSDSTLTINSGTINILKSYEGIESETITINDGNIKVVSSDDGVNASGGNDSSDSGIDGNSGQSDPPEMSGDPATKDGAPSGVGGHGGSSSSTGIININGGYIAVNATGDGIDSNGSIYMKGGTAIVNGPENDGNGALDYDGIFEATGGVLIAAGSSGMSQAPSSESTQNSIKVTLEAQSANTLVRIENEDGEEVVTFAPSKQYASVVVSSPKLKTGSTYKVYLGGSLTGVATDGIYSDGTYAKGEEIGSTIISGTVTEITQEGVTTTKSMGGPGGPKGQGGMKAPKQ